MSAQEFSAGRLRAGDLDRGSAESALQRAHAAGRLDLRELDQRRERVRRAVYLDELPELLRDLPEHEGWNLLPTGPVATALPATTTASALPAPRFEALPATAPEDAGFSVSVMSGRDLLLEPGTAKLTNFAWWGGNKYNLTQALGPGRTVTLYLHAVMAGNNIFVPPGVRVVDKSIAIMAGNEIKAAAQGDGSNGTLVIKGFLFWGGNTVKLARDA